jgi:uncharacterized membrane protein YgdD (TMEM256/DUF423 family)
MYKTVIATASVLGALAVMIGAFGAHKLKDYLNHIQRSDVFETAVKYQFYHTFAILCLGLLLMHQENKWLNASYYCFSAGIVLFSGSLYMLCATNISKWGAVTPIGGVLFIAGWILLGLGLYK